MNKTPKTPVRRTSIYCGGTFARCGSRWAAGWACRHGHIDGVDACSLIDPGSDETYKYKHREVNDRANVLNRWFEFDLCLELCRFLGLDVMDYCPGCIDESC